MVHRYRYAPVRNAFDAGKSITRTSGRRLGACEMASSCEASVIWGPKKCRYRHLRLFKSSKRTF
jgi:hypothetical protein